MKKLLTILFLFCSVAYLSAEEDMSALLITEGERGIALEWYEDYTHTYSRIYDMLEDEEGNVYVCGQFNTSVQSAKGLSFCPSFCGAQYSGFLCKYSKDGKLLWGKEVCTAHKASIKKLEFKGDSLCFLVDAAITAKFPDKTVYYDGEVISEHIEGMEKNSNIILAFCNKETGEFLKSSWVNFLLYPQLYKHQDDYIFCSQVVDSIANPTVPFKGQTSNGFYEHAKLVGSYDYYFAAYDEDMNVKWDFILGTKEDDDSNGSISTSLNGDTLFVYYCFYGDSVNISPQPENPVWVYGDEVYSNWDPLGAVLIAYDVSDEQVKLMNHRKFRFPNFLVRGNGIYSCGEKGTRMTIYNPTYKSWGAVDADYYSHAIVDSDLNVIVDSLKPALQPCLVNLKALDFDSRGGYYALTGEYWLSDSLLVFDFSDKLERLEFSADNVALGAINKFDKNNNYHYSMLIKSSIFVRVEVGREEGVVYVIGDKSSMDNTMLNYKGEKEIIVQGDFIAKYRETYKVSVDNDIKGGTLIVPDTLVWHGKDVEIGVNSDEGMCLKSLYANGLLLSVNEEGKYFLRNLSEPVVLSAEFVEASSIFEMESETFVLSSNSVSGYLELPDNLMFENYQIYTVEGKLIKGGRYSRLVDVNSLQPGVYQLGLSDKNNVCKITKFIKN